MRTLVITPPAPIVSLAEAKVHLRVSHDAEDDLIEDTIAAVTEHLDGPDGWLGRAIGPQVLEARFDTFCRASELMLPLPPIVDITNVKYFDADRVEQTIDAGDYELIDRTIYPIASSSTPWSLAREGRETILVRYRAGYVEDPDDDPLVAAVPKRIKAAILLMVGDMYANRETVVTGTIASAIPMSGTVENLLAPPIRVFA